jgi:uncharacterized protein YndB with AHSA1/START domain
MTQTGTVTGSLRVEDGKATVRMEDRFDTDADDLWSALTDPQRLSRWIGRVEGDLRLGGLFTAQFTSTWEGTGRVEVCEPPRRLLLTMGLGEEDQTVMEAEIFPDGDGARLVVEERGLPVASADAYGAGWQAHIEDLRAYLTGREPSDWRTRWAELRPAYRDQQARLV